MWIAKESEQLINIDIVKNVIVNFNLRYGFEVWNGSKVPFLFNEFVLIKMYIETGSLELSVSDIINWQWNSMPVDSYTPLTTTHKDYYELVTRNINDVSFMPLEMTKYLYYYINFIQDFLPEIFKGDFTKIKKYMKPMTEAQIEEIIAFLEQNK